MLIKKNFRLLVMSISVIASGTQAMKKQVVDISNNAENMLKVVHYLKVMNSKALENPSLTRKIDDILEGTRLEWNHSGGMEHCSEENSSIVNYDIDQSFYENYLPILEQSDFFNNVRNVSIQLKGYGKYDLHVLFACANDLALAYWDSFIDKEKKPERQVFLCLFAYMPVPIQALMMHRFQYLRPENSDVDFNQRDETVEQAEEPLISSYQKRFLKGLGVAAGCVLLGAVYKGFITRNNALVVALIAALVGIGAYIRVAGVQSLYEGPKTNDSTMIDILRMNTLGKANSLYLCLPMTFDTPSVSDKEYFEAIALSFPSGDLKDNRVKTRKDEFQYTFTIEYPKDNDYNSNDDEEENG